MVQEIEIQVYLPDCEQPKAIKIANDATIEQLLDQIQAADVAASGTDEDIILLVEDREVVCRRHQKIHEFGIKHGHHVHLKKQHHIKVSVLTTSGIWPPEGFAIVSIHQLVKIQLHHAAKKLKITNTTGWKATVGTKELNIEQNYQANGLSGEVEINFGPREGGGGNE
jgi:hypothetical protein